MKYVSNTIKGDLERLVVKLRSDEMSMDIFVPVIEGIHRCLDDILYEADTAGDEVLEDMAVELHEKYEDMCRDFRMRLAFFLDTVVRQKVEEFD